MHTSVPTSLLTGVFYPAVLVGDIAYVSGQVPRNTVGGRTCGAVTATSVETSCATRDHMAVPPQCAQELGFQRATTPYTLHPKSKTLNHNS